MSAIKQEVRICLEISIELAAHHTAAEVRAIVMRGAGRAFHNNHRRIRALKYAEEFAIYSADPAGIRWTPIITQGETLTNAGGAR